MKKNKLSFKQKPSTQVSTKERISFLEKRFVGKNIQQGPKQSYDLSLKDDNGNVPDHLLRKITKEDFDQIINADPTLNKQYSQWLLNVYSKGKLSLEDLYKATEDLTILFKFKNKVDKEKRDINQFEDLDQLYSAVQKLSQLSLEELSNTQLAKKIKIDGAEVILDSERWQVLIPLNYEASKIYGKGTRWCTASYSSAQFESYSKKGHLYIIIDKKAAPGDTTTNKFQWHFETNSYMDALDRSIDWKIMLKNNPELRDCFLSLKDGNGLRLKLLFGIGLKPEDKIIKGDSNLDWLRDYIEDELPEGLVIHKDVDLSSCKAKRIKNLTVYGKLSIRNSQIESINGKLEVHGIFDAQKSNLKNLPDNCFFGDSIHLNESKITKLPRNMVVNGHLFGSYLQLIEPPKELTVEKNLYLHGCGYKKEELDETVKIKGKLYSTKLTMKSSS